MNPSLVSFVESCNVRTLMIKFPCCKDEVNEESEQEDFSIQSFPISKLVISMINEESVSWVV